MNTGNSSHSYSSRILSGSRATIILLIVLMMGALSSGAELETNQLPPAASQQINFDHDIRPILEQSCFRCHGTERPKSHFSLVTRASALKGGDENKDDLVPGDSARSKLIHYVAQLVPDMEMPPPDKGAPLTPQQIGLLRAWIDQGANWGQTNAYPLAMFSVSPTLRWIDVSGHAAKFREIEGVNEGWGGGVENFSIEQQTAPDKKISAEGHFLFPDEDVQLKLTWTKTDVGFVRVGFDQWRKYFDDTGGFAPSLPFNAFSLNRDLHLDIGRAWIDLGLTQPGWPLMVLGYEYQFKRGDEATLQWGPVGTQPLFPPPSDAKNIFPASKHIDEGTHIIKFDISHELAGWQLADSARVEFYDLQTSRRNLLGFPTSDTSSRINESHRHTEGANSLTASKQLADWLSVSSGYFYSRLEGDASLQQNTINSSGAFVGGEQYFANDITLRRESHVGSLGTLLGPWHGATLSAGVQGEWTQQDGFGFENLTLGLPTFPPNPAEQSPIAGRMDDARVEENVLVRYVKIPYTVLFAETRLRQEELGRFEERPGGSSPFTYDTEIGKELQEYRTGFTTSPWARFSFGAEFKHSDKHSHYDPSRLFNPAGYAYPGFFEWRNIADDQVETRLVYRVAPWLRTSFNFRWRGTDFDSATLPITGLTSGGRIDGGNEDARVYSFTATATPCRKLFFSGTFSYTDSRTTTAQNNANYLVPWAGNIYSVLSSATYVLNTNTSFHATYAFSMSDYGQNNPNGLPLGINYDRHSLRVGVNRRLTKNFVANLTYAFAQYREPTSGGAVDYTAHGVFTTLTFAWR
jgi:hypothetical protein